MLVSMSAVVLLGLCIWFLLRIRYLRWADTLLCGTFGFLVAKTVAAPVVQATLLAVNGFLGQLRLIDVLACVGRREAVRPSS